MKRNTEATPIDTDYEEAKKALILMCLNQYSDFLLAETKAKEAEAKAYESMAIFGDTFKPEDLQNMVVNLNKIANNPQLQTKYYEKVHEDAQSEKNLKVVK